MDRENLIDKLAEMGVFTDNCSVISSFIKGEVVRVALYGTQISKPFYFYNKFDKKIYLLEKKEKEYFEVEIYNGNTKYLANLSDCRLLWDTENIIEYEDVPYSNITLRQYACIHLRVPESGLPWLDNIILKSK